MPRSLIALTAIVAIVAVSFGVKDYLDKKKEAKHSASVTAPVAVSSNPAPAPKKTSSRKNHRASARGGKSFAANQAPGAEAAGDQATSSANGGYAAGPGATDISVAETSQNASNAQIAQAAHDQVVNGADASGRLRMASKTERWGSTPAECVPLPNGTEVRDVDAGYYRNWAREYSCVSWH